MKKKLLQIILIIGLISCSSEKQIENEFDINGDFSKLNVIRYRISKDSLKNSFNDTISVVFNEIGKNGKVNKIITKTYMRNKPIETITSNFSYNSKRQILKELTDMESDKNKFEINYFYENDLLHFVAMKDSLEDFTFEINEKYNYDSNGKLKFRESFQLSYDFINKDTLSLQKVKFTYDNNEKQIKADWSEKYGEYPNMIEDFTNDSLGNVIKTISYDKLTKILDTTFYKYEYEYDIKKNWIERKTFKNDTLFQITKRIIE